MKNVWILDVIADLASFAQENGLLALAEQLDDTKILAAAEISQHQTNGYGALVRTTVGNAKQQAGNLYRTDERCKNAG